MKKGTRIFLCILGALLGLTAAFAAWVIWANTALQRTNYTIKSERLPAEFDGFCIAQISDLHNAEYDEGNQKLLKKISKAQPNIIVFTGDTIDGQTPDYGVVLDLLKACMRIAPCYFITGNHDSAIPRNEYYAFEDLAKDLGVVFLHDRATQLAIGQATVTLLGIDDENFEGKHHTAESLRAIASTDDYTILLAHHPEHFEIYVQARIDLTLSGHAHGGQARLPLIGGLYAPGQGTFPKYDAGLFKEESSCMVVSRGIGESTFPLRFNNRPELVIITLESEQN